MDIWEFYNGSLKTATIKGTSDPAEHLRQLRAINSLLAMSLQMQNPRSGQIVF
jgi:hypothetical protein